MISPVENLVQFSAWDRAGGNRRAAGNSGFVAGLPMNWPVKRPLAQGFMMVMAGGKQTDIINIA
jgi:hypothetical protein